MLHSLKCAWCSSQGFVKLDRAFYPFHIFLWPTSENPKFQIWYVHICPFARRTRQTNNTSFGKIAIQGAQGATPSKHEKLFLGHQEKLHGGESRVFVHSALEMCSSNQYLYLYSHPKSTVLDHRPLGYFMNDATYTVLYRLYCQVAFKAMIEVRHFSLFWTGYRGAWCRNFLFTYCFENLLCVHLKGLPMIETFPCQLTKSAVNKAHKSVTSEVRSPTSFSFSNMAELA